MKRLLYSAALVAAIASVGVLPACDDDPVAPTTGSISGTVVFQGTWPSTGQVQVSLFAEWPPMGAPYAYTDPIAEGTTYAYRFEGLAPATYPVLAVGWYDPSLGPGTEEILGIYWAIEDSVAVDSNGDPQVMPEAISVGAGDDKRSVDIAADLDVAP